MGQATLTYETNTDPVIAKGPEVMLDTVTQNARKHHNATGLLVYHAKCSQTPRVLAPHC